MVLVLDQTHTCVGLSSCSHVSFDFFIHALAVSLDKNRHPSLNLSQNVSINSLSFVLLVFLDK